MTKRILISGVAGFIGTNLANRFLAEDNIVVGLDNFSSGDTNNVKSLKSNKNFIFYEHDIRDVVKLEVDYIVNLACPASPIKYQEIPIETLMTNVLGAYNLLELARESNIPILQASTSEVYGDPLITPQNEEYWGNVNPIGERSCYDEGKRAVESLMFNYKRIHKTQIKVARIFNTFGPFMRIDDGRVISNLIVQALTNKPLTIYGDGTQTRSFCYVDDLIEGLITLMNSAPSVTGPINLGNPVEISMNKLAEIILKITHSDSIISYCPLPSDDPKIRFPDITKAQEILKWNPTIGLEQGLEETIESFQKRIKV